MAFPLIDPDHEGFMSVFYNLTVQIVFAATHFYVHT